MSTSYYFRKPISLEEIKSRTNITIHAEEDDIFLVQNNDSLLALDNSKGNIDGVKRYGDNHPAEILKELILKLGIQVVSEYVEAEFREEDGPIPDEVWEKYTSSFFK